MKAIDAREIFDNRVQTAQAQKELEAVFELIKDTSLHDTVQYMTLGIWSMERSYTSEHSNIREVCSDKLKELGYEVEFHNNITQIKW